MIELIKKFTAGKFYATPLPNQMVHTLSCWQEPNPAWSRDKSDLFSNQSLIDPSLSILLSHDTTSPFSFMIKDDCSAKQTTTHVFFTIVTDFGRKMENAIVIDTNQLKMKYQPLIGASFTATYKGIARPMAELGNVKDILEVAAENPFAVTLYQISSAVLALNYGATILEGITRHTNSSGSTNYLLWVEPGFDGILQEGLAYNFKIVSADVFPCGIGTISYRVSLKAGVEMLP